MKAEELFRPEDLPKLNRSWDRAFSKGSVELEVDLIRKDRTSVRHFFTMVRVEVRGKPHLVGIGIDLSSQRALAIETAHRNEEMAQLAQMASMSEWRQPYKLSNFDFVTESLTLIAGNNNSLRSAIL